MTERIRTEKINKTYNYKGKVIPTLADMDLHVGHHEFVSLIGPSGCGKSTLLNIFAGLETYGGKLTVNGTTCLMPQNDSMLPWRNVYRNICLPQEISGLKKPKGDIDALVEEFGLKGFEEAMPYELSGGMRKRAALLRTYLTEGDIMLLDEPFAALDTITRRKMSEWLLDIWQRHKKTVVFVTHDIEEAIFLSDRVYVFSRRPARVLDCIRIDTQRPRRRSDPDFAIHFEKIYGLL
ncbi:MAG: ABC transporter ATP-binding protein [Clostridia bacterium]